MQNPMCEQAWATDPQALYDWMEVNLASVGSEEPEMGRLLYVDASEAIWESMIHLSAFDPTAEGCSVAVALRGRPALARLLCAGADRLYALLVGRYARRVTGLLAAASRSTASGGPPCFAGGSVGGKSRCLLDRIRRRLRDC